MISLATWLKIRARIDRYFRNQALKPRGARVTTSGALHIDVEDIEASESAKATRRAAAFVIDPEYLPYISPEDMSLMRRALNDKASPTWVGHVVTLHDGRVHLELAPGVCEALHWRERDQIGFRRLYSGEMLTFVDRQARR